MTGLNSFWHSDNGGGTAYTQLDKAKMGFSLTSEMELAADPRSYKW
jgi:hypothetical protein